MTSAAIFKRVEIPGLAPERRFATREVGPWDGQLRVKLEDAPSAALLLPGRCEPEDEVPLEPGRAVLVGRSPAADLQVSDRWASRYHCELVLVGDILFVRDIGSTHGTMINEKPRNKGLLHDGDILRVGMTGFVVSFE